MLIAIATGFGMKNKIREKVMGFNGAIQVYAMGSNPYGHNQIPISIDSSLDSVLKHTDGIDYYQKYALKSGLIKTETDFEGVILKGVDNQFNTSFINEYLTDGRFPIIDSLVSQEVLLSKTIATKLQLSVGDEIRIWFMKEDPQKPPSIRKLQVVGLFSTGFPDFDNHFAIGDIRHIQKLNKWQSNDVGGVEVMVHDFDKISAVNYEVYQKSPQGFYTESVLDKFPLVFEWVSLFDSNISGIIILMVIIAGFNMISALLVLIMEQTRTIGILKAMGANDLQIRNIFIFQATYLIIKGLFWGNVIGLGLLLIQHFTGVITLNPEVYHVSKVPVYLNIGYILWLNLGVIFLTYLMLLLPSYYIAKISPVKTIKFE